ncbi:hypothetical protein [Leptolyngbya sp. NIES-2104]|uniref:hypothetical protein n=1 Tax=Leptolyngbya sp. NIES-2104 TaxID=1552121 RepID=UPI0006EC5FFC|nr:hypothetical protein [Leptolyngbya sp. NIES-2104]GAP96106.1 hypothetical protein NIES2104_26410 [Leptolyngbya sp. NIES-2104]
MSLNLPLKWQVPALGAILAATTLPLAITLYRQSNAQLEQRNTIEQQTATVAENERIALDRARRCLLINERYPLVEGNNAWYDPTNRKDKRLLPSGTALCSAASGYTAEVDYLGTVKNIRQAPIEKITQVLRQRGLIR